VGADISRETFNDNGFFALADGTQQSNSVTTTGTLFGAYLEDRWALGQRFAINGGLRYDHSTGFVGGALLSPRFEINYAPERATIFHAYYGRIYAAPALEDTRRDAVITQTVNGALPAYDLKPELDHYVEFGFAHTFAPGLTMYANAWQRNSYNVLDTTQLANTPLFAVFNNAIGHANGLELRVAGNNPKNTFFLSASLSSALAGGVSGSTFLFDPSSVSDMTLNPEDHDQSVTIEGAFTHHFGSDRSIYATIAPQFGTGYPVTFQDGTGGRLPAHLTVDASLGREPDRATHRIGVQLAGENIFNRQYLIKVNNGFNTTQWATGRRVVLRLSAAF
ncbi:MAG TPA: TonB-dependent receptor, partial [Caballeronia sp.]|nr:TonB-dependent receptor [Caballeronia sp.]